MAHFLLRTLSELFKHLLKIEQESNGDSSISNWNCSRYVLELSKNNSELLNGPISFKNFLRTVQIFLKIVQESNDDSSISNCAIYVLEMCKNNS